MAEILGIFHNMYFISLHVSNSTVDFSTWNSRRKSLKQKKTGKITYIKMERFLKFKIVTGYSLGIYRKVKVLVA